ncbi:hypothetical protein [Mycolicibacterium sp. 624]|uniref:hypothetical protein n=1 Tax=Mycolicibacterium sp. 624 TaxID=3156314 RepID=UPI00339B61F9
MTRPSIIAVQTCIAVVNEFTKTVAQHGIPYSTPTDNGMVFITRLAGGKGGRFHPTLKK